MQREKVPRLKKQFKYASKGFFSAFKLSLLSKQIIFLYFWLICNFPEASGLTLKYEGKKNAFLLNDKTLESSKNTFNIVHHSRHDEDATASNGHFTFLEVFKQMKPTDKSFNGKEKDFNSNKEDHLNKTDEGSDKIPEKSNKDGFESNSFENSDENKKKNKADLLNVKINENQEHNNDTVEDQSKVKTKQTANRKNPRISGVEIDLALGSPVLHFKNKEN